MEKLINVKQKISKQIQKKRKIHHDETSQDNDEPLKSLENWLNELGKWSKVHQDFQKKYIQLEKDTSFTTTTEKDELSAVLGTTKEKNNDEKPKIYAIDCEMVICAAPTVDIKDTEKHERVLARLSLIEWKYESASNLEEEITNFSKGSATILLDEYIKIPTNFKVVDLLTHVSGVEQQHIDNANVTLEEVQSKLKHVLKPKDILIGHSLWSDFKAMKFYHSNFLDTAMFFTIKGVPNFTPSLKDIAEAISKDGNIFQVEGESHDSCQDAEWAVRVLSDLLSQGIKGKSNTTLTIEHVVPHELPTLPLRFQKRLTVQRLPKGSTQDTIMEIFANSITDIDWETVQVRPIKWIKDFQGKYVGSCVLEFCKKEDVSIAFKHISCSKFDGKFPRCEFGWPDQKKFIRKITSIPPNFTSECEIVSYLQLQSPNDEPHFKMSIPQKQVGRVMGKRGRRINMIQQCNGVLIKVHQPHFGKGAKNQQNKAAVAELEFWGPSLESAKNAQILIKKALEGDLLGVQ